MFQTYKYETQTKPNQIKPPQSFPSPLYKIILIALNFIF